MAKKAETLFLKSWQVFAEPTIFRAHGIVDVIQYQRSHSCFNVFRLVEACNNLFTLLIVTFQMKSTNDSSFNRSDHVTAAIVTVSLKW